MNLKSSATLWIGVVVGIVGLSIAAWFGHPYVFGLISEEYRLERRGKLLAEKRLQVAEQEWRSNRKGIEADVQRAIEANDFGRAEFLIQKYKRFADQEWSQQRLRSLIDSIGQRMQVAIAEHKAPEAQALFAQYTKLGGSNPEQFKTPLEIAQLVHRLDDAGSLDQRKTVLLRLIAIDGGNRKWPKELDAVNRSIARVSENEAATKRENEARERAARRREGVRIGMTMQEVMESNWGRPDRVNRTTSIYGTREQWVYRGGNYLYFENGVLTTIQN